MTKFVNATLPSTRRSTEMTLVSLEREMFVDVHPCYQLCLYIAGPQDDTVGNVATFGIFYPQGQHNKPIKKK